MTAAASALSPPAASSRCAAYLEAQLGGNRREALRLMLEDGLQRGLTCLDIHEIIQQAQEEIGRLWQGDRITIAQEHMATAISQVVLSHVYQYADTPPPIGEKVLVACVLTSKAQKARALGADEFWREPLKPDRWIGELKARTRPGMQTKVLVIDDDERARQLIKRLLAGTPYGMYEAATGPEGVRLARESKPNVIFLDFLLQDMTAFDELEADPRTRTIPVIVVTSHLLDASEGRRLAADAEAILSQENLSRELAINRIRDALAKAGVATSHGS